MSREIAPFGVRMPPKLKEQLLELAQENRRSLNAEVVARLERSVRAEQVGGPEPAGGGAAAEDQETVFLELFRQLPEDIRGHFLDSLVKLLRWGVR